MSEASNMAGSRNAVHLTRGASYLIIQSVGTNVVQIVSFVILARLISTKDMGILAVLSLINATCVVFAAVSIPQAVTKFVAESISRNERSAAASAFYQALRATLAFSLLAVAVIYVGAPFLAYHLLGDVSYAVLFQVLALDVFFSTGALPVVTGALLGLQMFRETATVGLIIGGVLRQSLIILLILLMRNFVGLVVAWVVCDAASVIAYLLYAVRALGRPRFDFSFFRLLRFSLPLTLGNVASYAQTWFDRAILVAFVPLATLGIYNATLTAFGVLLGVSSGMNNMLLPAYSSIQESADGRNMRDAARLATRYSSFVLIPLALGLLATAKPALTLFVGQAYTAGSVPLMILSGAFALTVFGTAALSSVLLALGKTHVNAAITSLSVLTSIGIAYVLLPRWGIIGASMARALSMILIAVLTVEVLRREMGLRVDTEAFAKNLIAGVTMVAAVVTIQLVAYSLIMLPVYLLVGSVVYLLMLRLLKAVNGADIDLVRRFLGRRLSAISDVLSWMVLPSD